MSKRGRELVWGVRSSSLDSAAFDQEKKGALAGVTLAVIKTTGTHAGLTPTVLTTPGTLAKVTYAVTNTHDSQASVTSAVVNTPGTNAGVTLAVIKSPRSHSVVIHVKINISKLFIELNRFVFHSSRCFLFYKFMGIVVYEKYKSFIRY